MENKKYLDDGETYIIPRQDYINKLRENWEVTEVTVIHISPQTMTKM